MTEKISREEKRQAKALEKEQVKEAKALEQAKAQLAYLEDSFRNTKDAVERSPDPYARMHMENMLRGTEAQIRELAEKTGADFEEIMGRLGHMSTESMKKAGQEELKKLKEERLMHEMKVTLGDPDSRNKLYEFEHKARSIVERYGLDKSHLEPFIVPELPPELEARLAEVPPREAVDVEAQVRITETLPKEKKGFFRKLFGGVSAEEKRLKHEREERDRVVGTIARQRERYLNTIQYLSETDPGSALHSELSQVLKRIEQEAAGTINTYDGELSNDVLGPFASLRRAKPSVASPELPKETRFEKFKRGIRRYFTVGLFTAAAVAKPLPTTDVTPLSSSEGAKIEMEAPAANPIMAAREKADTQAFMAAHAHVQSERAPGMQSQKESTHVLESIDTPATSVEMVDTLASVPSTKPVDSLEKIPIIPPTPFPIDTAASKAKFMDRVRKIDEAEKQKSDVKKYTGEEAPVFPPLPTAPVSPGQTPDNPTKVYEAPFVASVNSAPPYQVLVSEDVEKKASQQEGIRVSYQDEQGRTLSKDSVEKKIPRILKKQRTSKDSLATTQETSPAQAREVTKKIYESFKKNLLERDFTNPNSYKKALQTIVTMYQLDKIAGSWYMDAKIIAPNEPLSNRIMNVPQSQFETRGGTGIGTQNFMPILTTTLNYAEQNQEHFGQVVMGMFHEYVHAWQRSSAGITDHVEREAQAHYFTLFPREFSEWRRQNYRQSDSSQYSEIIASFPDLDQQHKIMYAGDFEKYYAQLSSDKQVKYKPMHEKVLGLIDSLGRDKYTFYQESLAAAKENEARATKMVRSEPVSPLDIIEAQPFAEFSRFQEKAKVIENIPAMPGAVIVARAPETQTAPLEPSPIVPTKVKGIERNRLEQVAVPAFAPTKVTMEEAVSPLEPSPVIEMPILTKAEVGPQPVAVPTAPLPPTPPAEFPAGTVPMKPNEEYSPLKFDIGKDTPSK